MAPSDILQPVVPALVPEQVRVLEREREQVLERVLGQE
jgi:hypothetical protein